MRRLHPTSLITFCVRGKEVLSLDGEGGLPLGILNSVEYHQTTLTLDRADLVLLYTDGITEARSPRKGQSKGELFEVERLDKLLVDCNDCTAEACISRIQTELAMFTENAQPTDDQTLIAIRCVE